MTLFHMRPTRRHLLRAAASAGLGAIAAPALLRHACAQGWRAGEPFSLGVASGAPRADGFVLWTRLAPEPLSPNPQTPGGMRGGDKSPSATKSPPTRRCAMWCGEAKRPPSRHSRIRFISTSEGWSPGGPIGIAS